MVSTLVEIYFRLDRQSEYISKLSINNLKKEANQNWILFKIERKEPSKKQMNQSQQIGQQAAPQQRAVPVKILIQKGIY